MGASGVAVNTAVLWALTHVFDALPYQVASAVATQLAIGWNFLLSDRLVFHDTAHTARRRFARFWTLNTALIPVQVVLLTIAVAGLGLGYAVGNVAMLAAVFVLRYVLSARWVFPAAAAAEEPSRSGLPGLLPALLVPCAAVVAAPSLDEAAWHGLIDGGRGVALIGVAVIALALSATRVRSTDDELPVHDRQLDIILAAPALAAAAWLTVLDRDDSSSVSASAVVAFSLFAFGAACLSVGTRATGRVALALTLPLTCLPAVHGWSADALLPDAVAPALIPLSAAVFLALLSCATATSRTSRVRSASLATAATAVVLVLTAYALQGLGLDTAPAAGVAAVAAAAYVLRAADDERRTSPPRGVQPGAPLIRGVLAGLTAALALGALAATSESFSLRDSTSSSAGAQR